MDELNEHDVINILIYYYVKCKCYHNLMQTINQSINKLSNNQIKKIHKRILRLVYEMEDANFEDLLLKDNLWNVHENNIHTLLIEIYKSINNLSPPIMKDFFE